jgi:hypothetical protein
VKTVRIQQDRARNQHIQSARNNEWLLKEDEMQIELVKIAKDIVQETEIYFQKHPKLASGTSRRTRRRDTRPKRANPVPGMPETPPSSALPSPVFQVQEDASPSTQAIRHASHANDHTKVRDSTDTHELDQPDSPISVQPRSYLLNLGGIENGELKTGYINGKAVDALLDPNLETNLISDKLALEYNLQVHPLSDNEQTRHFNFEDSTREPIVGTVQFKWKEKNSPHARSFHVWCSVCRHSIRPLILGAPFVQKRRERLSVNPTSLNGNPIHPNRLGNGSASSGS